MTLLSTVQEPDAETRARQELLAILPLFEERLANLHRHEQFAWIEPLNAEERQQMKEDFATILPSALLTNDWSQYDDLRYSWQETAHVLANPDLTAALLAERDPTQEVPLRRP